MFIHDSSDIVVDITQFLNHAHVEGPQYKYITETVFLAAMAGWFYTRIYYLPFKVLKSILFDLHVKCALKFPGEPWRYPKCEGAPFFTVAVILLMILVAMHIWWFYLFCLILVKVLKNEDTDKGQVYESNHALEEQQSR
jgi:hypothetical protein